MDILLIDDEPSVRRTLRSALESMGHAVAEAAAGDAALRLVQKQTFDLTFLDLRLGREVGLDLLPRLNELRPTMAIVVVTAHASVGSAVEAMRRGAFDYLPKPFTPDQLRVVLERWRLVGRLRREVDDLKAQVRAADPETDMATCEPAMQSAVEVALRVAATDATLLLTGESGTGKSLLARAVHSRSSRAGKPLITVHCPSLSAELLESELFGHVRGAFTGAVADTEGKVAAAEGGTLFLDEVGDLPSAVQPKLLRLLQERSYERVGETKTRTADVRILAATNRDLRAAVAQGRFREDLYYRLNVIEVTLPALRQRPRDVPVLALHLLQFFARQTGKRVLAFTPEAASAIERYPWPGNIRELRNAVERGVILTTDENVGLAHLPAQVGNAQPLHVELGGAVTLDAVEAEHIRRVLAAEASLEKAADVLGIDPSTLYRKRKRYGI